LRRRLVTHIKQSGAQTGVVLNPATPISTLDIIFPNLDYVLIMSVNPGFGAQKFISFSQEKAQKIKQQSTPLLNLLTADFGPGRHRPAHAKLLRPLSRFRLR
jgi:pentose-5-phosphate-3-epimerase